MVCIVCFDVLLIIRFLTHDRYSCKVIKPFNYSVVTLAISLAENYLKLFIYMIALIAEDKSRYNDMNTILYEMYTNKP